MEVNDNVWVGVTGVIVADCVEKILATTLGSCSSLLIVSPTHHQPMRRQGLSPWVDASRALCRFFLVKRILRSVMSIWWACMVGTKNPRLNYQGSQSVGKKDIEKRLVKAQQGSAYLVIAIL